LKAAVFHGIKDVRLEEIEIPQIKSDEVLVRIRAALTCGTDRKMYLRGHPLFTPPFVFGHEFAGDIAKSMCENITLRLSGAFAEYVEVLGPITSQNLLEIPSGLSYKEAALVEPLACVVHGIENSNIALGDTVVINGLGPIGLMYVQLACLKGARVIATDIKRQRLNLAEKLGADEVIDISKVKDAVGAVRKLTEKGRGVDVAIEATGIPEVWEKTILMVRKGGIANLFGGCPSETKITIDTKLLHYSQITIKGKFFNNG